MLLMVVTSLEPGCILLPILLPPLAASADTGSTQAVEYHIVPFQEKTGGYEGFDILGTALDLVHLTALATLEMVMVGLWSRLIARCLTGQLHLDEPAFFHESLEGAIDRGNAQTRHVRLRNLEYLVRTQRAPNFFENAPNSPTLASITFHGKMVHRIRDHVQC